MHGVGPSHRVSVRGAAAHAVYLHEKFVNPMPKAVTLVKVSHILLCVSSLMAHSMTIPVFDKQTPWHNSHIELYP